VMKSIGGVLLKHLNGQFRVSESANLDIYGLLRVRRIVP
jgi:hypothetical protein